MSFEKAVINRLGDLAKKLTAFNQSGAWYATSYGSVTTSHSEFSTDTSFLTAKFSAVSDPFELTISGLELTPNDDGAFIDFTFYARMNSGGTITVLLEDTTLVSVTDEETTFTVDPVVNSENAVGLANPSWNAYRAKALRVFKGPLNSPRLDVTILFEPNDPNDDVYFSCPVVSGFSDHLLLSQAVRQMIPQIPQHIIETDDSASNPPAAFTRFVDVAFTGLDKGIKALIDYRYFTIEDGRDEADNETLSDLVWPSNADFDEIRWLAQFSGTEPIAKLSSSIEPSDPFILDSSTLNSSDTLRFSSTGVLDPPVATTDVVTSFLRWQAQYGYYGINAGSVAAIREATKRVMVGAKEVTITPQHEGPFTLLVETPWDQTYGGASDFVGTASDVVTEAIHYAKPIGVKVTHRLT